MARVSPIRDCDPPQSQIIRYRLTSRQISALRRSALKLGIPASELLRRLLDQWIERNP